MKKYLLIISALALYGCAHAAQRAAAPFADLRSADRSLGVSESPNTRRFALPREAYDHCASVFLTAMRARGQEELTGITSYLREKIRDNENRISQGSTFDRAIVLKSLDLEWIFPLLKNHTARSWARFMLMFVKQAQVLVAHRIQGMLQCYTGKLEYFEAGYGQAFEKVSAEEYARKCDAVSHACCDDMLIEEAALLAQRLQEACGLTRS